MTSVTAMMERVALSRTSVSSTFDSFSSGSKSTIAFAAPPTAGTSLPSRPLTASIISSSSTSSVIFRSNSGISMCVFFSMPCAAVTSGSRLTALMRSSRSVDLSSSSSINFVMRSTTVASAMAGRWSAPSW